ncbi:MAG: hypothetical protein WC676_07625 [Candidatus Omnitrophota bacterium]
MKKILSIAMALLLAGCVTVKIPKYLQDEFPYKKQYFHNFDDTLAATTKALENLGWRISETTHPSVFEHGPDTQESGPRQVLIFTEVRQTPLILSSRYMSLNVYLKQADGNSTDVEIRYVSVMPVLFKSVQNYKNDSVVYKIFDQISELLEK